MLCVRIKFVASLACRLRLSAISKARRLGLATLARDRERKHGKESGPSTSWNRDNINTGPVRLGCSVTLSLNPKVPRRRRELLL